METNIDVGNLTIGPIGTSPSGLSKSLSRKTPLTDGEFSIIMANLVSLLCAPMETEAVPTEATEALITEGNMPDAGTGVESPCLAAQLTLSEHPVLFTGGGPGKIAQVNSWVPENAYFDEADMEIPVELEATAYQLSAGYEQAQTVVAAQDQSAGMVLKAPTGDFVYQDMEGVQETHSDSGSGDTVPITLKVGGVSVNQSKDFEISTEIPRETALGVKKAEGQEQIPEFEIQEVTLEQSDTDSGFEPLEFAPGIPQAANQSSNSKRIEDGGLPLYTLKAELNVEGKPFNVSLENPETIAEILAERSNSNLPKSIEFTLDPPGLGKITVLLSSKGEQVLVKFIASFHNTHQVLVNSQDDLGQALSERGLSLTGFFVDHGMAEQSNHSHRDFAEARQTVYRNNKVPVYRIDSEPISNNMALGSQILDYRV